MNTRDLKSILKEEAAKIKTKRLLAKELKLKGKGPEAHSLHLEASLIGWEYRHMHIAYCELRGRSRDQIEKPSEGNLPNEKKIQKIKEMYTEVQDESTLCVGQN